MSVQTIQLNGKTYVVVERDDYDRLLALAKATEVPPLPDPDANGNYPAVEFARATIARGIIRDRVAVGLSQKQLARKAGIAVETLSRIETGKVTPSLASVEKIDSVLKRARKPIEGAQTGKKGR